MIQNAIPDFESFGRNVINKSKRRYAVVIHEINQEIKAAKAKEKKEKEERKEQQRKIEKGKARSRSQSSSDEDSSSSDSSAGSKNKTNSMQFSGGEASSERSKNSSVIRIRKMDNCD